MLSLFGCSATAPEWVLQHPNDSKYWHGVGRANIKTNDNPKEVAKHAAIHELSQQIKVNISSEMKTMIQESDGSLDQSSSSMLKSRVNLLLPELEIVEQYKSKTEIFYYVRLHKKTYYNAMAKLRENAKESALRFIQESEKQFDVQSFISLQQAWNEIQPFLDEPISVTYDGQHENLYALIKQKSKEFIQRIQLTNSPQNPTIRTYLDRQQELSIVIIDRLNKQPLSQVPLKITFNNVSLSYNSDQNGQVKIIIPSQSRPGKLIVAYQLNISTLLDENSIDTNKLIFPISQHSMTLTVLPVTVSIESNEKNLGNPMSVSPLSQMIKDHFRGEMEFVESGSDMTILIESDTQIKSERLNENYPFFAYGRADITFKDNHTNSLFFTTQLSNVKGGDFSAEKVAGIRAYESMEKQLRNKLLKDFK